ncbi:MAG TPA: site-specific integrase, partial [Candidatus Synoicihabitans sp.]|nr:site-specific integrase [Candidatus Synoicihabitans sp.]
MNSGSSIANEPADGDADAALPPGVVAEWLAPFMVYLEKERRYSLNTVRNYRWAFVDFHRWLRTTGLSERPYDQLTRRDVRDFVIEAQQRFDRRTLHLHVSGLRAFFRFWLVRGRIARNPLVGVPLPKLEKRLPQFLSEEHMKRLLLGPQRLFENQSVDAFTAWRD